MHSPRDTRQALRALRATLDQWAARGELVARAPDLLAAALRVEMADAGSLSQRDRRNLAEALADRLGSATAHVASEALPELSPWRGQPGFCGECYLDLLTRLDPLAARDGQVFTPWPLALHLASLLEPARGQRWLDPAAGAAIFLQAAAALGADMGKAHALEPDPVARLLGRLLLPAVHWRGGDALADWSGLPADWRGGFERVVLNPPYRNGVERRDEAWAVRRRELKARFTSARGPFDLYVPFVERALELLAPGGRLGLLLPTAWLASRFGQALRRLLAVRADLLHVQHAPGRRLIPRANVDLLLLVAEKRGDDAAPGAPLRVARLDAALAPVAGHEVEQRDVARLAEQGWGPLLCPPQRRRLLALTAPLGKTHAVAASLSAAEYYQLQVREGGTPRRGELLLLSSGALEPFRHTWGAAPVRFRGAGLARPLVRAATLSPARRRQTETPRVLVANLSRRLEALAVPPRVALGVVNVIQILCDDEEDATALAAWLNSGPLQEHVETWHDPLRLGRQLSLTRALVAALPAPPDPTRPAEARDARRLRRLGRLLARLGAEGRLDGGEARRALAAVDAIAGRHLPLESDSRLP